MPGGSPILGNLHIWNVDIDRNDVSVDKLISIQNYPHQR